MDKKLSGLKLLILSFLLIFVSFTGCLEEEQKQKDPEKSVAVKALVLLLKSHFSKFRPEPIIRPPLNQDKASYRHLHRD